ncbi:RAB7A-interacting MON1-CCZ1 complex subunit 1 isoform X1 [Pleurodeles waltl]|uniref:RAB7A-interacting MON1-CCZ1 complex subunit 1 isoform X1 n=1 Tax=Pleurodeles waltl TaxID=8319 RepID=UPI00370995BF
MSVQIESLLQERAESLEKRWESLERAASREDCFFEKASATLERLKTFCREGDENLDICMFLQLYAQTVLDITYFEENTLVDGNFPEDSSLEQVTDIINILSEPENLIKLLKDREEHANLTLELLECLYWRRGALLYMYCHTIRHNEQKIDKSSDILSKFLKEGISYLLTMLNVKCPVKLEGGVSFQDLNTATLLSQGVFSDTHLLAMMYAGEMCYWILKHCEGKETPQCNVSDAETSKDKGDSFQKDTLDFQDIGEKMLLKYVSVCEGPLKGQGWSTENAIEILDFLKKIGN